MITPSVSLVLQVKYAGMQTAQLLGIVFQQLIFVVQTNELLEECVRLAIWE